MKRLLIATSSCVVLAAGCNRQPTAPPLSKTRTAAPVGPWQQFTSSRGGYSVEFPGKPSEKDDSIRNARSFSATLAVKDTEGVRFFSSGSTTYLKGGVARIGPQKFLERLYQEVWAPKVKGRLVYKRSFKWRGWSSIEFRYGSPPTPARRHPTQIITRQFIVEDTLHDLTAILPQSRLAVGDATHFFQSFRRGKAPLTPKYSP